MQILKFPHPELFIPCTEVTVFGSELKTLLDLMWEVMVEARGLGLAANQVGLRQRMFTMQGIEGERFNLVNPKIVWKSRAIAKIKEGCLSAPGEFLFLNRADIVKVEFQDENGEKKTKLFGDVQAICVQHEIEHLDGKAFIQNRTLSKEKRQELARKWGLK